MSARDILLAIVALIAAYILYRVIRLVLPALIILILAYLIYRILKRAL